MHRVLLITTDPSFKSWRTAQSKLDAVKGELNSMDNADFYIDIEYRPLTPAVHKGHVTHEWMDSISEPERQKGYWFVALHMSNEQRKRWGIVPGLRGAHQVDTDAISELYFWADEHTRRGGFNQFVQIFLHEIRHALRRGMGLPDDTHAIHGNAGDIKGSFVGMDMAMFHPALRNLQQQFNLLNRATWYLTRLFSLRPKSLFAVAYSYLGRDASPQDIASDVVGCAESVSTIIRDVLPDFPIITGTWTLNDRLQSDRRFTPVTVPRPGTIIISPTGASPAAPFPGHTGICSQGQKIMSSNSYNDLKNGIDSGDWTENYTINSWWRRYVAAGYPVFMYQLTNEL